VGDGLAIDNIDFEDLRLMAASPGAVFDVQIACEPGTDPGKKYKEATKMVDIFVFIVGVFEFREIRQNSTRSRQLQNI
jgi:hypothetical protein